jgi:proline iminopeptidase
LALAYGEKYPNSCLGFVMSGILLGTEREYTHLWYGMKDYFPEIWEEFAQCLPSEERSNLILGYYSKLMSEDTQVQMRFARAFVKYIFSCVFLRLDLKLIEKILQHDLFVHSFAKIFIYYSKNNFFLLENQLLEKVDKLIHLPVFIVQGRHDKLCPARSAYKLYKKWPGAELIFVEDANHPLLEAGMAKVVVEVIDKMKDLVKCSVG